MRKIQNTTFETFYTEFGKVKARKKMLIDYNTPLGKVVIMWNSNRYETIKGDADYLCLENLRTHQHFDISGMTETELYYSLIGKIDNRKFW